jgi:hypothetical protein
MPWRISNENRTFYLRQPIISPIHCPRILLVDLVNNLDSLEDPGEVLKNVVAKVPDGPQKKIILSVREYANIKQKKK